jgi:hypothetical protein
LNWQRTELTLAARQPWHDFVIAARAQGGLLFGRNPPPQSVFELGGEGALPGYGYKEFAGNHAATAGVLAGYAMPLLRRPWRVLRGLVVPGVSPGIAVGIQGGWVEASTTGARSAIVMLRERASPCSGDEPAPCSTPISTSTNGVRATVDARLTILGGILGFGVARPVDHASRWRLIFRAGQDF